METLTPRQRAADARRRRAERHREERIDALSHSLFEPIMLVFLLCFQPAESAWNLVSAVLGTWLILDVIGKFMRRKPLDVRGRGTGNRTKAAATR